MPAQFFQLSIRYAKMKLSGLIIWLFIVGQPIIIYGICVVTRRNFVADGTSRRILPCAQELLVDYGTPLFCVTITVIFFGILNSVTDISSEVDIYESENKSNIYTVNYIFSKLFVLMVMALIPSLAISWIVPNAIPLYKSDAHGFVKTFCILYLLYYASYSMGLLVSALVERKIFIAQAITPYLLLPQMILSGMMVRYDELPAFGKHLSDLTVARWGFEALLITTSAKINYSDCNDEPSTTRKSDKNTSKKTIYETGSDLKPLGTKEPIITRKNTRRFQENLFKKAYVGFCQENLRKDIIIIATMSTLILVVLVFIMKRRRFI